MADTKMRRFKQQLPDGEARRILDIASNGVLSMVDDNGAPYGVPLSFVFDGNDKVYFHCARQGRKLRCLDNEKRVSFCVVAQDDVMPDEFTTYFRSVIAEGCATVVNDEAETEYALRMLAGKYSTGIDCAGELDKFRKVVTVLRLDLTSVTGKESIELTRKRKTE